MLSSCTIKGFGDLREERPLGDVVWEYSIPES